MIIRSKLTKVRPARDRVDVLTRHRVDLAHGKLRQRAVSRPIGEDEGAIAVLGGRPRSALPRVPHVATDDVAGAENGGE